VASIEPRQVPLDHPSAREARGWQVRALAAPGRTWLKPLARSEPPGPQYFRIHEDLFAILKARLTKAQQQSVQPAEDCEKHEILAGSNSLLHH
jgi:hypothetical protein